MIGDGTRQRVDGVPSSERGGGKLRDRPSGQQRVFSRFRLPVETNFTVSARPHLEPLMSADVLHRRGRLPRARDGARWRAAMPPLRSNCLPGCKIKFYYYVSRLPSLI